MRRPLRCFALVAYLNGISLRRALTPPGYHKEWHVGVRVTSNKKLVAFITGIPVDCKVYDKFVIDRPTAPNDSGDLILYFLLTRTMKMAEINFLCVHKKLRDKRLAPVLIKCVAFSILYRQKSTL
jgi:glycylpeptide N-tetradecanoyltransferase